MDLLIEKLNSNTEALVSLQNRYKETLCGTYWNLFATESERQAELKWIVKVQKRVMSMRHTVLENIKGEAVKGLQGISTELRQLNLKAA